MEVIVEVDKVEKAPMASLEQALKCLTFSETTDLFKFLTDEELESFLEVFFI